MSAVRISMPADLADALVDDRVAVRPFATRGTADELFHLVIDDVNTGASVVTVIMAAAAVRKFAGRTWERLRKSGTEIVTITVTAPGTDEPRELKIRADDADGEDKVLDFMIAVLPQHHG
jgi:hypothetical protein